MKNNNGTVHPSKIKEMKKYLDDYMRIKGSASHITASGHLHARTEQDQGEKEANTST